MLQIFEYAHQHIRFHKHHLKNKRPALATGNCIALGHSLTMQY